MSKLYKRQNKLEAVLAKAKDGSRPIDKAVEELTKTVLNLCDRKLDITWTEAKYLAQALESMMNENPENIDGSVVGDILEAKRIKEE